MLKNFKQASAAGTTLFTGQDIRAGARPARQNSVTGNSMPRVSSQPLGQARDITYSGVNQARPPVSPAPPAPTLPVQQARPGPAPGSNVAPAAQSFGGFLQGLMPQNTSPQGLGQWAANNPIGQGIVSMMLGGGGPMGIAGLTWLQQALSGDMSRWKTITKGAQFYRGSPAVIQNYTPQPELPQSIVRPDVVRPTLGHTLANLAVFNNPNNPSTANPIAASAINFSAPVAADVAVSQATPSLVSRAAFANFRSGMSRPAVVAAARQHGGLAPAIVNSIQARALPRWLNLATRANPLIRSPLMMYPMAALEGADMYYGGANMADTQRSFSMDQIRDPNHFDWLNNLLGTSFNLNAPTTTNRLLAAPLGYGNAVLNTTRNPLRSTFTGFENGIRTPQQLWGMYRSAPRNSSALNTTGTFLRNLIQ